MTIFQGWKIQ